MLHTSELLLHRTGKLRSYILKDQQLTYGQGRGGIRQLQRAGVAHNNQSKPQQRIAGMNSFESSRHAFPLLTHTDFGYHDHAANTKWVELGNYMPKRNKGTPPWWRGADTYSPLYSEQGRYEYQRHLMISRFPYHYKRHFQDFLLGIRSTSKIQPNEASSPQEHRDYILPQQALHWILRMIVDNFNPQHTHYLAAMRALMTANEFEMARDVWRVMERQQTWPDDKLVACYLELCTLAREPTWAIECWNRYCNEKTFLQEGEADPKPVTRVPFTLNRDELLYLPKWKKFFDHDPNLDVSDLNRFNTTRNIYRWMCMAMLRAPKDSESVSGTQELFETLFDKLEASLLSTPTPVPEPPHPHLLSQADLWGADPNRDVRRHKQWQPEIVTKSSCDISEMNARFLSNEQFLVRTVTDCIAFFAQRHSNNNDDVLKGGRSTMWSFNMSIAGAEDQQHQSASSSAASGEQIIAFCDQMHNRLKKALGDARYQALTKDSLFATILSVHRSHSSSPSAGDALLSMLQTQLSNASEVIHSACYLEVLRAYADEAANVDVADGSAAAQQKRAKILESVTKLATILAETPNFEWTSDHHFAVMRVLVNCNTMTANRYFVANILRKFHWDSDFCELLYHEYRRNTDDVDHWAELTKRMLVWTERYNVRLSENAKRLIETDYDTIRVQVRSFRDVAVFAFRDAAEKKESLDPASQLPNPVSDYVSHALPFPDRDTGYPNEYGDIGQWRHPESGIKGPELYAPAMHEEAQRGMHGEWRENTATANSVKLAPPYDKKYVEYNRGRHPSYDQIYAGPHPEIFPARYDFRRPSRWDFHSIEKQSKFKAAGPY